MILYAIPGIGSLVFLFFQCLNAAVIGSANTSSWQASQRRRIFHMPTSPGVISNLTNSKWNIEEAQIFQSIYDHQFPQGGCTNKKAISLVSSQKTGLGTVIIRQMMSLLKYAMSRNLIMVIDSTNTSPYFMGCPEDSLQFGKFECLFQPITSCKVSEVQVVESTKSRHREEVSVTNSMSITELHIFRQFVSRPSDYAIELALTAFKEKLGQPWDIINTKTIGIHVRQGRPALHVDGAREGRHVWSAIEIIEIMHEASNMTSYTHFLIISDDVELPVAVAAQSPREFTVAHFLEALPRSNKTELDCVRDLGCDERIGVHQSANVAMIEMMLISLTHAFIGTKGSGFSILMSAMIAGHLDKPSLTPMEDEFDLDARFPEIITT